jgi:hypothetical protein
MSTPEQPLNPQFTRRSVTESICMNCLKAVRTDRYTPLSEAEDIHTDVCLQKAHLFVRYGIW